LLRRVIMQVLAMDNDSIHQLAGIVEHDDAGSFGAHLLQRRDGQPWAAVLESRAAPSRVRIGRLRPAVLEGALRLSSAF
jgi:hypothetical protein